MRVVIVRATHVAIIGAVALLSFSWSIAHAEFDLYQITVREFLARCDSNGETWCRARILGKLDEEGERFCLPADRNAASGAVETWLRTNVNTQVSGDQGTMQEGDSKAYRGIRSALGNLYGEMGKACSFPDNSAKGSWTGPGWYLADDSAAEFGGDFDIASGPFRSKKACMKDAKAHHADRLGQGYECDNYKTNPNS